MSILRLAAIHPEIVLPVAHSVIRRLSPFVRNVDFAVDWVLLDSGQAVYRLIFFQKPNDIQETIPNLLTVLNSIIFFRNGDVADSIFVLLSGRLRSVEDKKVIEEFGRGDVLGMIEVIFASFELHSLILVKISFLSKLHCNNHN